MATSFTFHFRPSSNIGGLTSHLGTIVLRIIHLYKAINISTCSRVYPNEWDESRRAVTVAQAKPDRVQYLLNAQDRMDRELLRLEGIMAKLQKQGHYTVEQIAVAFRLTAKNSSLTAFVENLAQELCDTAQERTARINKPISTHYARHSWAMIAKNEKLPLWVISEGLGHSNEMTTYNYLASFDRTAINLASDQRSRSKIG